ncbi:MAG: N-acetyltransferase [Gammaproteobacteria bacterium]|nr:N-acetyltransferase [Gammaproteobacteria bacterium]MCP5196531.1 N-acetyltransferase [Gammaproteobacteria bacterium]
MRLKRLDSLNDIAATEWNALIPGQNPFLSHEFLSALERHQCVGEQTGWLPWHVVCQDDNGRLLGAAPLYLKYNSYGEFVFDWSWAEAYRRQSLPYYPKLVGAIPYTPVTSPRLLLAADQPQPDATARAMIEFVLDESRQHSLSSIHWLFPSPADLERIQEQGFLLRLGCQFHWRNRGYRDFPDFLDTLTAKRRKTINRERRRVREAGLELRILSGRDASEAQWRTIHEFYRSTFHRLGGVPTLTLPFFQDIAATLGERIVLVLAFAHGQAVAGAISFRSIDTLYGRHWGCQADHDSLHFEACYYQGLEYCIENGLQCFEPGAQGEHKIYRGFLPTLTYSAHWIAHSGFRRAIADFLNRETPALRDYVQHWLQHSPYRDEVTSDAPAVAGSPR